MSNRPPTLQDVAHRLGMHKSTVSLALSGKGTISAETRRRVAAVALEIGYEPDPVAQRLARGQGQTTVCLFSGMLDVGLATEKILLIQRALTARGLETPLYTCPDVEEAQAAQVRQLCRQRPRSLICATQRVHPAVFRELTAYQQSGGLVVSYDTPNPLRCDQIVFDREDNAFRAATYVLEQGHRRVGIGMSQIAPDAPESDPQQARLRGFRRALEALGLPMRPEWIFLNSTYERGGAEMARRFLALPPHERPTALCIVNDYVALAFMAEVLRAGIRIPQDLSVIGHDDQPIAAYCPVPLTSLSHPAERIARTVADRLLARLDGDETAARSTVTITGELVVRASVAPPSSP